MSGGGSTDLLTVADELQSVLDDGYCVPITGQGVEVNYLLDRGVHLTPNCRVRLVVTEQTTAITSTGPRRRRLGFFGAPPSVRPIVPQHATKLRRR